MLSAVPLVSRLAAALLVFAACASFEVVRPPLREADLYPFAEKRAGVSVAVVEIGDPGRAERYFGTNLLKRGILPVQIVVSNHGNHRISVRPADLLLLRGRMVIDPRALDAVSREVRKRGLWVTRKTARQIDEFLGNVSFKDTVLAPGESYQGVLFFDVPRRASPFGRYFRVVSLFAEPTLKLHVAVTDLESGDRLRFGPFGLYSPSTRTS